MNNLEKINSSSPIFSPSADSYRPEVEELKTIIQTLPTEPVEISPELANMSEKDLDLLVKAHTAHSTQPSAYRGVHHYGAVLKELDRLKNKLGGSPVFGKHSPTLDILDHNKTFFGVPISAVKDWFKMVLERKWIPVFFWRLMARIFNVSEETKMSRYEECHTRIQRFGLMIEHKEYLKEILESKDQKRYAEMHRICGLAWHPKDNSGLTEQTYIELIDQFLSIHFDEAKKKGDDALIEFFNALEGVCFEDRARYIEEYVMKHPTAEGADFARAAQETQDWDTGSSSEKALLEELMGLGVSLQRFPTPLELREKLEEKDFFNLEFTELQGKQKPTLESYHEFVLRQTQMMCLDYYTLKDFLNVELETLFASGRAPTRENFIAQLEERMKTLGSVEVYYEEGAVQEFNIADAFHASSLSSTLAAASVDLTSELPLPVLNLREGLIEESLSDLPIASKKKWTLLSEDKKQEVLKVAQGILSSTIDVHGEVPADVFVTTRKSKIMSSEERMKRVLVEAISMQLRDIKK